MNTETTDDSTKKILANSLMHLDNPMFAGALMQKISLAERRKLKQHQVFSKAIFWVGIIIVAISLANYFQHAQLIVPAGFNHSATSLLNSISESGKWMLSYLKYAELFALLFVISLVVDANIEVA